MAPRGRPGMPADQKREFWRRGSNENTNGLRRQYLPKGADMSMYSQAGLDAIAWKLNAKPRKTLGYRTPAAIFVPTATAAG